MAFTIPSHEIRSSLAGAFKILAGDKSGMDDFNVSSEGFWRSFQVILFVFAPVGLRLLAERSAHMEIKGLALTDFPTGAFSIASVLGISIDWLMMPVLLALAAPLLKIRERYGHYVIARNWASLISACLFAIPSLLYLTGLLSLESSVFFDLSLLVFLSWYSFRICRVALQADIPLSIGIVVFEFVASIFLGRMLYVLAGL